MNCKELSQQDYLDRHKINMGKKATRKNRLICNIMNGIKGYTGNWVNDCKGWMILLRYGLNKLNETELRILFDIVKDISVWDFEDDCR